MDLKAQITAETAAQSTGPAGTEWFILSCKWIAAFMEADSPPGPIDNSDIVIRAGFLSSEEEDYRNVSLRGDLQLHKDYEIVSVTLWEALVKACGAHPESTIKRYSRQVSDIETQIEVSLTPLQVVFMPKKSVGKTVSSPPHTIYVSKFNSLFEIKQRFIRIANIGRRNDEQYITKDQFARLWKLDIDQKYEHVKEMERMQLATMANDQPMQFPGELLGEDANLEEAKVSPSDLIVLEAKDNSTNWRFCVRTPKCKGCGALVRSGAVKCNCEKEIYCTERCKQQNRHICDRSSNPYSHSPKNPSDPLPHEMLRASSKGGLTGLQNLGNTCYMNSALQCAAHTQFLVDFFLSGEFRTKINRRNPIGCGGRIAEAFAGLMVDMWVHGDRTVAPWDIKQVIGRFSPLFQGYHQHDSQELLAFLLDGLHEDVNEVTTKPYLEELKLESFPSEEEKARAVWQAHLSRNKSVIVDNMHGQYRTQLTCPKCKLMSFAYDPFLTLTVDMPKKGKLLPLTFIPLDPRKKPIALSLLANKSASIDILRQTVAEKLKIEKETVLIGVVKDSQFKGWAILSQPLSKYVRDGLAAFEVLPDPHGHFPVFLEMTKKSKTMLFFSSEAHFALPRLMYIDGNYSAAELHRAVFAEFSHWLPGVRCESHPVTDQLMMDTFPELFNRGGERGVDPYVLKGYDKTPVPFEDRKAMVGQRIEGFVSHPETYQLFWQDHIEEVLSACTPQGSMKEKELTGRTLSLAECLAASCSPKELDTENTWTCPKCGKVQAIKEMTIFRASKVLLIHLKRFKQSRGYMTKNDNLVGVPKMLDISPFMKNSPYTSQPHYYLYAVSCHSGGLGGGHYTAYAQVSSRWYSFNDSSVHPVDEGQVCQPSSSAYVLCYARTD